MNEDANVTDRALSTTGKFLLAVEVIVCFAPVTIIWAIGFLISPNLIAAIAHDPINWQFSAFFLGAVACGLVGLGTLLFILNKLYRKTSRIEQPALVCTGIALGALPIVVFALSAGMSVEPLGIIYLLPLIATAHILYLSRKMLFPSLWAGVT